MEPTPLSSEQDIFCFPIPEVLENDRVKLVPFIPSKHAQRIIEGTDSDTWAYLPFGPFDSAEHFVQGLWEDRVHLNAAETLFVVFDKTRSTPDGGSGTSTAAHGAVVDEPAMAGLVGYLSTSPGDLCTEIGFVIVFPAFQRTHVASNMIGLLLHYALDLSEEGGLGLRRVQWKANVMNSASVGLAMKLGFKEAIFRWAIVLRLEKAIGGNGLEGRKGDQRSGFVGRDSVLLAICCDDWEGGGKERVDSVMNRMKK